MFARDQVLEAWLREEVVNDYDVLVTDADAAVSVDDVRARLSAKHD